MWTVRGWKAPAMGRKVHMPKTRPPYPKEFREHAVALARSAAKSVETVATESEPVKWRETLLEAQLL